MFGLARPQPRRNTRHRDFSVARAAGQVEVTVDDIDAARTLFLTHPPRRYRPLVALLRSAFHRPVLIVSNGEAWRRTHDAVMPALLPAQVARAYAPVIRAVADESFSALAEASRAGDAPIRDIEIDVERLMRVITTRILGLILFGRVLSVAEAQFVEQTLDRATKAPRGGTAATLNRVLGAVFGALKARQHQPVLFPRPQRRALDDLLRWIAARIVEAPDDPSLLANLKARYGHLGPRGRLRAIAAEYAMMFVAGIETTAAAATFAVAEIAHDSALRDAATAEARRSASPPDRPLTEGLAARHPTLFAVVQETLRRHTIVPIMSRETAADVQLPGKCSGARAASAPVTLRRGTVFHYLPVINHMRRSLWKDPRRFDPGRYAQPLTHEQKKCHHPFGIGVQSCPGRAMATTEAVLILNSLLEHLDLAHQPSAEAIASQRNVINTLRPLGVTARVSAPQNLVTDAPVP